MEIVLTVIAGPHQGRTFTFTGHDTFLVGRSRHAHFQLAAKDPYFSRMHFLVEVHPPRCRLTDLGSRNGTYVNNQRVKGADLRDGDEVRAGHTLLRVQVRPTVEDAATGPYLPASSAEPLDLAMVAVRPPAGAPQPALPAIAGYRLVRELGRGGMGVVYLAERESDGSQVAVKTIIPAVAASSKQIGRFLREAEILQQLDHPHIVAFRDQGEANGLPYFVMDYVPGTDAARLLKQHGRLPVRAAVRMLCQVLSALEYAHARRFVHRDIKPANLLLTPAEGRRTLKLADFGLARIYQASQLSGLTLSGDVGGTVSFLPPEQITRYRDVQPPADQYAAAATLYTLLTGRFVYDFDTSEMQPLVLILQEDPVPIQARLPDLSDELAAVIHRALARNPAKRYADAGAFREALLPFGR
jgi:serine/threonine-protein kinase